MVFSSVTFLFFFLPAVICLYYVTPRRGRNGILTLASLAFYVWGAGWFAGILLGSIVLNHLFGIGIARNRGHADGAARAFLVAAVVLNVAVLAWFKYLNLAVHTTGDVMVALGGSRIEWVDVILPIGISFYTFHAISYIVDVWRGVAAPLRSLVDYALYITFFPQLVAGPIVRFHEIRDQLLQRRESSALFAMGIYRFAHGIGKKVLIADTVAPIAGAVFSTPPGELGTASALLGVVAYAVQLYFDFSGYTDMALGLGLMFGLRLPENFDRPYASRTITEFWRRWHMSLSRWFRDYLYIPLGGNRGSSLATYRNLVLVFLITGLWHGAAWTFLAWGAYHGALLLVERRQGLHGADPARIGRLGQARTIVLVLFGWILFRSPDLPYALGFVGALARPFTPVGADIAFALDPLATIALVVGCASVLLPRDWVTGIRIERPTTLPLRAYRAIAVLVVLPIAIAFLVAGTFSPFLYFQF